ncbi:hypothetical protein ABZX75_17500 [Streptomyces sp. NPDC003038]|uniref:hypothetical protein n=1 Tax=unclassified Streptomyces TaxID=2593676 RepID=UPI0033BE7459
MATDTDKLIPAELAQQIADQATIPGISPIREAHVFNLLAMAGYTNPDIGSMIGRRASYVGWRLDLLQLTPAGQAALEGDRLPANLAWHIALLSEPNQFLMLVRWARGEFSSARHAERYARAIGDDENSGGVPM